ncbi:MAG TPA: hypothetical protein VG265_13210 [Gaiellaceae bacterium]|nr:hypothetical protein [Gaiellaceae bacterium]
MKAFIPLAALAAVLSVAGCGGSSSSSTGPNIQPAAVYKLTGFKPSGTITAGRPVTVSFSIRQPDGTALTKFKKGPGPHTGVHLILVRDDLAYIIHQHPPIAADGTIAQSVTFPAPGPYRLVVDIYPASGQQTNFQLFGKVEVGGTYVPKPLPAAASSDVVNGYRFTLHGAGHLKAIEASLVTVDVTDPTGKPVTFTPWFGALAHAIFFRKGSLDYFHTHVCAPGVTGCTSVLGPTKVTGTSTTPGKLKVGVLVPAPGTWRLFVQCKLDGTVFTAPFTLVVR